MQSPSTAAPSAAPTIFLVNQFSHHGHLDLYARLYSACLLELGYRVVLIAQQESGICEWIAKNCEHRCDDFFFFSRGELKPAFTGPLSSRIRRVWQEEGVRGLLLRIARRKLHQALRRIEIAASALGPRFSSAVRRVGRSLAHSSGVGLRPLVDEVNTAEGRLGIHPDLVFFLYLDMINNDRQGCRYLAQYLRAPWAGIQFDPRCSGDSGRDRSECIFRCSNARGAAFLNPHSVPSYERTFPALRFGCLPDVTDASILATDSPLVTRLRSAAGGRTIVLQLGTLGPHKGVMQLIDVIRRADPSRFFFALVGEVPWQMFGRDEHELRRFAENPPEHCLVQASYLEDERELNSIVAAADILFAVYKDFRQSSNTLTKAAAFKKPVIVSDGHMMGERVSQYDLGTTVRFGNVDDIISALERLRRQKRDEFGFSAYCRDHSVEALKINLATLLKLWLRAPQAAG
jgi:glycosyltransferase involved in cell wall biosynthesis